MPEVIFPGPEGRLEGRFHPGTRPRAPVALILHSPVALPIAIAAATLGVAAVISYVARSLHAAPAV